MQNDSYVIDYIALVLIDQRLTVRFKAVATIECMANSYVNPKF